MKGFFLSILFLIISGCTANQTRENQTSVCDLAEVVADYQLSTTDLVKLKHKVNEIYSYPDGSRPQQTLQDEEICRLVEAGTIKLIDPAEIKMQPTEAEPDIIAERLGDDLYYIAIKRLTDESALELNRILRSEEFRLSQGLVLDLRGNLGGTLYSVTKIAQLLGPANLVIGETKGTFSDTYYTEKPPVPVKINKPIVVVVDGKTSSGAELLAAFVQNHRLGTVIGEKTAAAGLVRTVARINQHTIMTVPVNYLFDSNGHAMEGKGVEPDIMTSQTNCTEDYQYGLCKSLVQQAFANQ